MTSKGNGNAATEGQSSTKLSCTTLKKTSLHCLPTGTSSEVSKDTDNIQLDDSTLLDICQEGIEEMAKIALDDYPNEFLTGYVEAFKDNIRRLRGEPSD